MVQGEIKKIFKNGSTDRPGGPAPKEKAKSQLPKTRPKPEPILNQKWYRFLVQKRTQKRATEMKPFFSILNKFKRKAAKAKWDPNRTKNENQN